MKQPHNTYFFLRHGRSLANEQQLIVSDPTHGISGYGLTDEGKKQVRASAQRAKDTGLLDESTIIVSSDFARAKETAQIAADVLGVKEITFSPLLRERTFGKWDMTHNSNYQKIWDSDARDYMHAEHDGESVADVVKRGLSLINNLEEKYVGKNMLLVSHGDTLQILQTVFGNVHPSQHRNLRHLETAEIRKVN